VYIYFSILFLAIFLQANDKVIIKTNILLAKAHEEAVYLEKSLLAKLASLKN